MGVYVCACARARVRKRASTRTSHRQYAPQATEGMDESRTDHDRDQ